MKILNLNLKNKNFKIPQLTKGTQISNGGRNNQGRITVRHKGGGVKKLDRLINYRYLVWGLKAVVLSLEYAPKRTNFLSLICFSNGLLSYVLATDGVKVGDIIDIGINTKSNDNLASLNSQKGSVFQLKHLVDGAIVHNVEIQKLKGIKIARAAGTSCTVVKANYKQGFSLLKMPSGEERIISDECVATVGISANSKHSLKKLRKAGQNRRLGVRPTVRGVAMNPVDHPHGGGEGKTSGAGGHRSQVTFKGLPAKGVPTRSKKKDSSYILIHRKKKNN